MAPICVRNGPMSGEGGSGLTRIPRIAQIASSCAQRVNPEYGYRVVICH